MAIRMTPARKRLLAVCGLLLVVAAAVPPIVSATRVSTPGAPTIVSVSSLKRSAQMWDLKVAFRAPTSTGGARLVSTTVSAGGRTCTARHPATSCVVRNLRKDTRVSIVARTSNSRGPGKASTTVRYVVGSRTWTRPVAATTTTTAATTTTTAASSGARPYEVYVPTGYSASRPAPLVILLHGYSASGELQTSYMGFRAAANSRGFLFVAPDGTRDAIDNRFWNATETCCDFAQTGVDDEAYLVSIIESVRASHSVDPKRIYLVGHSNGGFMSYRMACRRADLVAGIANLAGAMYLDRSRCSPSRPVSILHVHGTNDATIEYNGGAISVNPANPYPGALDSARHWVDYNDCSATGNELPDRINLVEDNELPGADTVVTSWSGCASGSAVQLWTIVNGKHTPALSSDFSTRVVDFLFDHPRP